MSLTVNNLSSHLLRLSGIIQEIINDVQSTIHKEEEDDDSNDPDYVTAVQFARYYTDLLGVSAIRKRLRSNENYFKSHITVDENGHIIFCPIHMLELIERSTKNTRIKIRCQRYLNEWEECD